MPRTIAIGDIHGCVAALAALLDAIDPQPGDTLITLGDYIDRGPDSRAVIDLLLAASKSCELIPLLGNHEIVMLCVAAGTMPLGFWIQACGGQATLASYGGVLEGVPDEHWKFLRDCRRHYETDTHQFLHANYLPGLPLDEQPDEVLFWTHLNRIPPPHKSGKQTIVGHTPQPGRILHAGHVVCIDTFCCGSGCLTAYDVDTGDQWQADKSGVLLAEPKPPE